MLTNNSPDHHHRKVRVLVISSYKMRIWFPVFSFLVHICLYTSAQVAENQPNQSLQLPENIWPQLYTLEIFVELGPDNFGFWGNVVILVMCTVNTNTILVNACSSLDIPINNITVVKESGNQRLTVNQEKTNVDEATQILTIFVEEELTIFEFYEISISFSAALDTNLTGLYRSSYYDTESQTLKWLAVSQADPVYARCIFPSMDQPNMNARFIVSLGHQEGYTALTNSAISETVQVQDRPGWVLDRFERTKLISTYMVTLAVSDFVNIKATLPADATPVNLWSRKDVSDQLDFALEIMVDCIIFFEEYFKLPSIFNKMDAAVIPDFQFEGKEGFAMVTLRESDSLIHPDYSSAFDRVNAALVVSNCIIKQWMGDYVTMKWWDNLWLKEGFTNYFAKIFVNNKFPEWKIMEVEIVVQFNSAWSADGLLAAHALSTHIDSLTQVDLLYDTISYRKGYVIAHMLNIIVGNQVFNQAMIEFISTFARSSILLNFLWDIFTKIAGTSNSQNVLPPGVDIGVLMAGWIDQPHYPLVSVKINPGNGAIIVSQEAFIFNPDNNGSNPGYCWWIPLFYVTSSEMNYDKPRVQWMKCGEDTILDVQLEQNEFLLLNVGLTALCRVDYGPQFWPLISQTLLNQQSLTSIDVLSRVQLTSDMYGLAWKGRLLYSFLFETFRFLAFEKEFAVWRNAWVHLASLRKMLAFTNLRDAYQQFVRDLSEPVFSNFGDINEYPNDDVHYCRFKAFFTSWLCAHVSEICQVPAVKLFQQWFKNSSAGNPIDVNVRTTVYCQGIVNGGLEEWKFLWEQYQTTNVASEKTALQRALGCSQNEDILMQYLEYSIDPNYVRPQDSANIFTGMSTNDASVLVLRKFFYNRFQVIFEFHRGNQVAMGKYLTALYSRITTFEELQEMEAFIDTVADKLKSADLRLTESRSMAADNIAWLLNNYEAVAEALQGYTN